MFAYFDGSLEVFLNHIREIEDNRLVKIRLAPATMLDDIGIVNRSYHHVLDSFAVNHIMHRHGGRREYLRGQTPITLADLLLIPEIFTHYDSRSSGRCRNGNLAIIYTKAIEDQEFTLIEEVWEGHSELATSTLYKRKRRLTDAKSPSDSADSGFASFLNGTHRRKELNSAISGFVPTAKVSNNPKNPNNLLKLQNHVQTPHPFPRAARGLLGQRRPLRLPRDRQHRLLEHREHLHRRGRPHHLVLRNLPRHRRADDERHHRSPGCRRERAFQQTRRERPLPAAQPQDKTNRDPLLRPGRRFLSVLVPFRFMIKVIGGIRLTLQLPLPGV